MRQLLRLGWRRKFLLVRIMTQAGTLRFCFPAFFSLAFIAGGLFLVILLPLDLDFPLLGSHLSEYVAEHRIVYLPLQSARLGQLNELILH